MYFYFSAESGGEETGDDDPHGEIVSAEEEGESATLDQPLSPRNVAQEKPEPPPSAELETAEEPPTQPGK